MYTASTSGRASRSTLIATKPVVQPGRDLGIVERLTRHDVAPVAGGVPDREQHGHVARRASVEGLVAPGPPGDRLGGRGDASRRSCCAPAAGRGGSDALDMAHGTLAQYPDVMRLADLRTQYRERHPRARRPRSRPAAPVRRVAGRCGRRRDARAQRDGARHGRPGRRPSVRMVLLKGLEDGRFVFYTNLESRKARALEHEPRCALSFWWDALERQVRVEGRAQRVDDATADAYFASRPPRQPVWAPGHHRRASPLSVARSPRELGGGRGALPGGGASAALLGWVRRRADRARVLAGSRVTAARPLPLRAKGRRLALPTPRSLTRPNRARRPPRPVRRAQSPLSSGAASGGMRSG
jgi:hypothetical protein